MSVAPAEAEMRLRMEATYGKARDVSSSIARHGTQTTQADRWPARHSCRQHRQMLRDLQTGLEQGSFIAEIFGVAFPEGFTPIAEIADLPKSGPWPTHSYHHAGSVGQESDERPAFRIPSSRLLMAALGRIRPAKWTIVQNQFE